MPLYFIYHLSLSYCSQLTIFKVEEKHFRLYECVAWNSVGNSTATVAIGMLLYTYVQ